MYADVVADLHARIATVSGIEDINILDYEPTAIHNTPTVYSMFQRGEEPLGGGREFSAQIYFITHRLVLAWQDNEQAEQQVGPFINSIPAAIRNGTAFASQVVEMLGGFITIGGTEYRIIDFISRTKDRDI